MPSNKRTKDQAMAAYMKEQKIERRTARCPMCGGIISVESYYSHVPA